MFYGFIRCCSCVTFTKDVCSAKSEKQNQCALNLHSIPRPPDGDSCGCEKTSSSIDVYEEAAFLTFVNTFQKSSWVQSFLSCSVS